MILTQHSLGCHRAAIAASILRRERRPEVAVLSGAAREAPPLTAL